MEKTKIVALEDRIPKLKQQRRKKANRRLILLLFLFFSLIAVVAYVQSPLSHIKSIQITGNDFYSNSEIIQKTGLTNNTTNIWAVNKKNISAKLEQLPEIKKAIVTIHFPNSLDIQLTEHKRIAYLKKGSEYFPVLENGTILKNRKIGKLPMNAPVLDSFIEGAVLDELLKEIEKLPGVVLNSISEIHYTPVKTDRFHITLYMNDGFEVSATTRNFAKKMALYPSIVSQLNPHEKGIIDLEVGSYFKAFNSKKENKDKSVR